jgi:enoyl-CoA hydratase/carnithine racemase
MLSGRRYDGAAAVAAGIANASATEAELLPAAIEQARPWSGKRPDVLHGLKTQLYESVTAALDGGTDA